MRHCPDCKTALAVLECGGIEVDYCFTCAGSWLDQAELGLLLDGRIEPRNLQLLYGSGPTRRRCPVCRKTMREARFRGTDIVVDTCPLNHGLWLDRGELATLVREGAHQERVGPVSSFYQNVFLSPEASKPRRIP